MGIIKYDLWRDKMYLYKITNNINQKIYIGITNDYKKRWANHGLGNSAISQAIKKYGKENFTFEVLFKNVSIDEIDELEIKQIQKYNSLAPNGYNIAKGGRYNKGGNKPLFGNENGHSLLSYEEAKYIKEHRNEPMYVLYNLYSEKISYETFKKVYKNKTYLNIIPTVPEYPNNIQFSSQFSSKAKLGYDEVCELREQYYKGIYWKEAYEKYKNLYPSEIVFWKIYTGRQYSLVKPEVFTEERKNFHASLGSQGSKNGRAKLTEEDVKKIRELHRKGINNSDIYVLYPQVSKTSIRDIINKKTWKNIH